MSDVPTLMPPSATPLMRALDLAIRPEFHAIPHVLRWLYDPQCCPPEALPHLAWAWSVDVWNDAWPEEIKRRVIADSLAIHRIKGSVGSVKRALATVAVDSELVEWHQLQDAIPHTFTAILTPTVDILSETTGVLIHDALIDEIKRVIDATKPLRSHYLVRVRPRLALRPGIAAGLSCRTTITTPAAPTLPRYAVAQPLNIAAALACRSRIDVRVAATLPLYAVSQPLGIAMVATARSRIVVAARTPPLPRYETRNSFRITAGMRMGQKLIMTMTPEAA